MNRLRAAGGGLLLVILVAACSSGSSPSEGEATPTPVVTPTPDEGQPTEGAGASFVPGAGELESIVPTEVGDLTLEWTYATGNGIDQSEAGPEIRQFLNQVGADLSDVQIAVGFAYSADPPAGLSILAIRVQGADESRLLDEYVIVMQVENEGATTSEMSVGGKSVTALTDEGGTAPSSYLYVKGDVIFQVGGDPLELVEDALSQLP